MVVDLSYHRESGEAIGGFLDEPSNVDLGDMPVWYDRPTRAQQKRNVNVSLEESTLTTWVPAKRHSILSLAHDVRCASEEQLLRPQ